MITKERLRQFEEFGKKVSLGRANQEAKGELITPLEYREIDYRSSVVAQSRELINSVKNLSLDERRIVYMMISQINSTHGDNPRAYRVDVKDFADLFGVDEKNAYNQVKKALNNLYERSWQIITEDAKGSSRWISDKIYHNDEGWAEATFAPKTMFHLQNLGRHNPYKSILFEKILSFKEPYTWTLYELLNEQVFGKKFEGWLKTKVDALRLKMEVPSSYNYGMFKQRFLLKSIQEIKEKLNLKISIREIKTGRKITSLHFIFEENEQHQLNLE